MKELVVPSGKNIVPRCMASCPHGNARCR